MPGVHFRARTRARRGALLAEVGIATVALMIVMALMAKVLGTVAHERRSTEARQRGLIEVGNLMERITARPFDLVTPELARTMTLQMNLADRFGIASSPSISARAIEREQKAARGNG